MDAQANIAPLFYRLWPLLRALAMTTLLAVACPALAHEVRAQNAVQPPSVDASDSTDRGHAPAADLGRTEPSRLLPPDGYVWTPEAAPPGQIVIVISLPQQRAHVYRSGVRIGISTISSGKPGHATPTGVFPILEKRRVHRSNLYDNAPMPYMQRLTWDGIALHAGQLPGHPASHGCIRLPNGFAGELFAATQRGEVVVVADQSSHGPDVLSPGDRTPVDTYSGRELRRTDDVDNPKQVATGFAARE